MTKAQTFEPRVSASIFPAPRSSYDMGVVTPSLCSMYTHTSLYSSAMVIPSLFDYFQVQEFVDKSVRYFFHLSLEHFSCRSGRGRSQFNHLAVGTFCADLVLCRSYGIAIPRGDLYLGCFSDSHEVRESWLVDAFRDRYDSGKFRFD